MSSVGAPLLQVSGLVSGYGRLTVLQGVDLDVARGQLTAIMGPSGSGKSTLMHILAALDRPTSGYVTIAGTRLGQLNDNEITRLRRKHIGFVFQFFNLLPMLTAEENVLLPLELAGGKIDKDWTNSVIESVGLTDRKTHRPSELSGGQQQRVAIARALIMRPEAVICDEPTSALDVSVQSQILNLLQDLQNEFRLTYVFISHDLSVVRHVADDVMVMNLGDAVEYRSRDAIFAAPEHPYTRTLFAATPQIDVAAIRDRVARKAARRA